MKFICWFIYIKNRKPIQKAHAYIYLNKCKIYFIICIYKEKPITYIRMYVYMSFRKHDNFTSLHLERNVKFVRDNSQELSLYPVDSLDLLVC